MRTASVSGRSPASPRPAASIIIPVRGDVSLLDDQLRSICRQATAADVEVIIVDNGPTGGLGAVASQHRGGVHDLHVLVAADRSGPSYARNRGAEFASADVLLFLDADDEVGEHYLEMMIAATRRTGYATGKLEMVELNRDVPAAYRSLFETIVSSPDARRTPFAPGCSLGVGRDLFHSMGGFDERLRGCEDVDLGWRLHRLGIVLHREDNAVVHYRLRTTLGASFRQGRSHTQDHALLFRIHGAAEMERRGPVAVLRHWLGWLRLAPGLRTRGDLQVWLYLAGRRWGLLRGAVRHRALYL